MLDPRSSSRVRERVSPLSRLAAATLLGILATVGGGVPAGAQGTETSAGTGWTQFQGDAGHDGVAATGPAPPYAEAWSFPVAPDTTDHRSIGLTAPVIAGNTVIAVGATAVYGVGLGSGQQEWTVAREGPPAPPAVAEVDGRSILLFTDATADGVARLRAIDLRTQGEVWKDGLPLKSVSRSGVTVEGSTAFLGDADGNVYAVDIAEGAISWTVAVGGEPKGPLAVADGMVFAVPLSHTLSTALAPSVVALDASSGEQAWRFTPPASFPIASLAASADGSVVVVAPGAIGDGEVFGLSTSDRAVRWSVPINSVAYALVSAALGAEAVYVIDVNGGLHAIAPGASSQSWQFQFNELALHSSPILIGEHVLVGLGDGTIAAVEAASGHLVWRSSHLPGVVGPIAVSASLIVAVVGGNEGGLVAFRHDDAGTLVDQTTPTDPRWGTVLRSFATAAVAVGLLIGAPLTLVVRRFGPPVLEDHDPNDHAADEGDADEDDDDADDDGDRP